MGLTYIRLESNRRAEAAINLYRKAGFTEVPVDSPYARCDICMVLQLGTAPTGGGVN